MNCPLCQQPLLPGHGPTISSTWQEVETDAQTVVTVHLRCAWVAVRDNLYALDTAREGQVSGYEYQWVGWEPIDHKEPGL